MHAQPELLPRVILPASHDSRLICQGFRDDIDYKKEEVVRVVVLTEPWPRTTNREEKDIVS
ncbi:hypothetical protein C5167_029166 [Papaver somniferum]|nr:hypothetical protein C5167_029166 [Papaver somniferum]